MTARRDLPAGEFSAWLRRTRAALAADGTADVPCGDCCVCCETSHFVHVRAAEVETLARIPRELLVPAPGEPAGTLLLGYDERGRCPLLRDGRCSIYEQRPLTCLTYDCRVFAAAGIVADGEAISRRAERWRFTYAGATARREHAAVRAAARFVRERAACFPGGAAPRAAAQVAVLAVEAADVFLGREGASPGGAATAACLRSGEEIAAAVVEAVAAYTSPPEVAR